MNKLETEPEWCFPEAGGKGNIGINNNMPDNFKGNPWDSLIRECCQNALDASDNNKVVIIEFQLFKLQTTNNILKINELKKHIFACQKLAQKKSQNTAKQIFDKAVQELNKSELLCLRISDFNTTGLRGSKQKENEDNDTQWFNCVRSTGSSGGKNIGSAGSQGLGKATTFLNSAIRTVFFNTFDIEKNAASEGVAQLISHYIGDETKLDGTGYFGCTQDNQKCRAFYKQIELDPSYSRKESGTDVFIIGLNSQDVDSEDIDSVIKSFDTVVKNVAVDSFLPAIRDRKIIIKTSTTEINKTTLPEIMNYLSSDSVPKDRQTTARNTVAYNAVMDSEISPTIFNTDDLGIKGQLELKLLVKDGLNKKIAIYREVGMKIMEKRFNTDFDFSGTLIIKGDQLNEFMKNMETTDHKKWQPNTYQEGKERKLARLICTKIDKLIKHEINTCTQPGQSDQMDSGLGYLLPDTCESAEMDNNDVFGLSKIEDPKDDSDFIEQKANVKKREVKGKTTNHSKELEEDAYGDITNEEYVAPIVPKIEPNNKKTLKPNPYRSILNESEDGPLEKTSKYKEKDIALLKKEIIPLDNLGKHFLVKFKPNIGAKNAKMTFKVSAEIGSYKMRILSATHDSQNLQIENKDTVIGLRIRKNKEYRLELTLCNNSFKSFLVRVYAYKSK